MVNKDEYIIKVEWMVLSTVHFINYRKDSAESEDFHFLFLAVYTNRNNYHWIQRVTFAAY